MRRIGFLAVVLWAVALPALAQTAPDYAIRLIRGRFSADNREAVVEFDVVNIGSAAALPATASLALIATGEEVAQATVPPLGAGETYPVALTFAVSRFAPGSVESLRAAVGVNEVEPAGGPTIQNNFAQISLTFPAQAAEPLPIASPTPPPSGDLLDELAVTLGLDWTNPLHVAAALGVCGFSGLLVLLIAVMLRLALRRPPDTGSWQPTYGGYYQPDPNSAVGRRQQWQMHAQNASLPPNCAEGSVYACKRLFSLDGKNLAGWRVTAARLTQYDLYGRIGRSQVHASRRAVRRIDRAARRGQQLRRDQLVRRLRPAARGFVGQFSKRLNARTASLPVALDVRFQGKHGEVRILFELYQCRYGTWNRLDLWEPEMAVAGKTLSESYTYALFGQRPGETLKAFRQRLVDDLVSVLVEMIQPPVGEDTAPYQAATNPHLPKVEAPPG